MAEGAQGGIAKFPTDIPGFEYIADGGLPAGRATLLAGSSGSGKSIFAAQFLAEGISQRDHAGVFVTFEEPPAAIRDNFHALGWPIPTWEDEGRWAFVDLSPEEDQPEVAGDFDLGALLPRIEHAVRRTGAQRLVIDSLGTLYSQFSDRQMVRRALGQLMAAVRRMGVTTLVTAERTEEYGPIARFEVEEFVADSVILLRNVLNGDKRRRTVEILKMRGTSHQKGEYPFTVSSQAEGVSIIPLSAIELNQPASSERASFGVAALDAMCAGGLLRKSVALVAGPTGTGKSLIGAHFATGDPDERSLVIAFEEGADQLRRNAAGWSLPFEAMEAAGTLRIESAYPETASLEDHLVRLKKVIDEFQPQRVVLDSLSALERIGSHRGFREFLIALVAHLKDLGVTTLMTANTSNLQGGGIASEAQVSSMTDTIILLRYAEQDAQIKRGLVVLKMRGSDQDKAVREFTVTDHGIAVGEPFAGGGGSLLGFVQA
jgi:circadian clock protein KaiC